MPTLDELQKLDDGQFHSLCDDLFRLLEPRYRRLRTRGLNLRGQSVPGQPDSYVGETANTCQIAFQYSVQRAGWWNKVVEDVQEAVAASPAVEEIVVAIPRDVDREGPKGIDWHADARAAAGKAKLRVYDGKEIAGYLDRDHQDLRFDHLQIPYSRLSRQSILASCQRNSLQTIEELKDSGRYDPSRYISRTSDQELYRAWQRAVRTTTDNSHREESVRLIGLVNDSGVGKTSLLCSFVSSLGAVLPVVFLQGRDLSDSPERGLLKSVMEALQGALAPSLVSQEEAALVHHLPKDDPLTVVVDGLDESKDIDFVRSSLRQWFQSRLGQTSLLIVSSRPEFWRQCSSGQTWTRWMLRTTRDARMPANVAERRKEGAFDPSLGVRLPEPFSGSELERAWMQAGENAEALHALSDEMREELRHPFTLRTYLDLRQAQTTGPDFRTRADVLAAWLDRRLGAEEEAGQYLTRTVFQDALRAIALKLWDAGAASLALDDLSEVPRFSTTHPPGPVVERMIAANILEVVPGDANRIRFAVEAVQDFFLADAEVLEISANPSQAADQLAGLTFTKAHTRLARIGQRLQDQPCRNDFVVCLAERDPAKAGVVLRAAPLGYEPSVRKVVAEKLGQDICSRYRVRGALAVELLSDLHCPESAACLLDVLKPSPDCPFHLRATGAFAFAKLGCVEGASFTYTWPWFSRNADEAYYFQDALASLRTAKPEFKAALADEALKRLDADSGTREHSRAVCVLGYLADERLVPHLGERLLRNGRLLQYENHALIAVGTEAAANLYARSGRVVAKLIEEWRKTDQSGNDNLELHFSIDPNSADLQDLVTPAFEAVITSFIRADHQELSYIGLGLARSAKTPKLVYELLTSGRYSDLGTATDTYDLGRQISPETWLHWWNQTGDGAARQKLLHLAGRLPNPRVEEVLIECLDHADLQCRSRAAWELGRMGSHRAVPYLKMLLSEEGGDADRSLRHSVVGALGRLRDPGSVPHLLAAAKSGDGFVSLNAVCDLGWIGTPEAESALLDLAEEGQDETRVAGALVIHGSPRAVAKAIAIARRQPEGPKWLDRAIGLALSWRGHRVGEYYDHIYLRELVPFIASGEHFYETDSEKRKFARAFRQIDGKEVRQLLYEWAGRMDTPADSVVRDDGVTFATLAYWELLNRGDDFAVPFFVKEATSEDERRSWRGRDLVRFSTLAVAKELRQHLSSATAPSGVARILNLFGLFGGAEDAEGVKPYLDDQHDEVADAAHEAFCRMTDPMRVPRNWGGLR